MKPKSALYCLFHSLMQLHYYGCFLNILTELYLSMTSCHVFWLLLRKLWHYNLWFSCWYKFKLNHCESTSKELAFSSTIRYDMVYTIQCLTIILIHLYCSSWVITRDILIPYRYGWQCSREGSVHWHHYSDWPTNIHHKTPKGPEGSDWKRIKCHRFLLDMVLYFYCHTKFVRFSTSNY